MVFLAGLHATIGLFLALGVGFLSLAALPGLFRPLSPWVYRSLRLFAWMAILQVALGFGLMALGLRPREGLHLLYGLLLAAGLHYLGGLEPGGWFYRGLRTPPRRPEVYVALGLLFALGLTLRVYATGG